MTWRKWQDLKTTDFDTFETAATVVVLPISAVEQHGPHLPLGTDAMIAEGLLDLAREKAKPNLGVLELPMLSVCASAEHRNFAGSLSISSSELADQMVMLAQGVQSAGFRKLVIVSSHGGNVAAMTDAALRCRAELNMLAVHLSWMRLGLPDGVVEGSERAFGVHGGFVETSMMLHFRPDLVDMARAENFTSMQQELAAANRLLRAYGPVGFGWMAEDLNPHGVVGNASQAAPDAGREIAELQAAGMITLLEEIAAADLEIILRSSDR